MEDVILRGPRLFLRPLKVADFSHWQEIRKRCADWLDSWEPAPEPGSPDPTKDRESFRMRCGAWERQRHFDSAYGFGMFLHDGQLIGEVSLGSVQRGPFQSAFIGYWVDCAHAGKGYTPEGVAILMRYGFESLGLHRIEAAVVPRNKPSVRVVEKVQMREEGIAERFLQIQGVWEDHLRFAMTQDEWQRIAPGLISSLAENSVT